MTTLAERQSTAAPVIALRPVVKFCNQCGKVFDRAHADCRSHVPPEFAAPRCPQGQTEHWYCVEGVAQLVCHLDIDLGEPATDIDPAVPAKAELYAAYLNGVNVFDVLLTTAQVREIEEDALRKVQS